MATSDRRAQIVRRVLRTGLSLSSEALQQLDRYLELLTRWNRRLNLTALPLEPLTDAAVDRLIVEPLQAAGRVRAFDRFAVDIGSGGGSPAIPLKLAVPHLRLTLVESRTRKAAFLREVVRTLGLAQTDVANCRFEDLQMRPADLITVRAVRPDAALLQAARSRLRLGGRVFLFMSFTQSEDAHASVNVAGFQLSEEEDLVTGGRLVVLSPS